jgi:hypothetical protein
MIGLPAGAGRRKGGGVMLNASLAMPQVKAGADRQGCVRGFKKWNDARTRSLTVTYSVEFPYAIGQPNNPDVYWIQDRTTAPK